MVFEPVWSEIGYKFYPFCSESLKTIQFNFYFSHIQRDSVQYIKNNKHLYYKGGLKGIRINLFSLV